MYSITEALILYGILAGLYLAMSVTFYIVAPTWRERRTAARAILLTPIWPAVIIYGIYLGIRSVIKAAFDK